MYLEYNDKTIEIDDCTTFLKRLIGFMFRKKKITFGKRFPNCNSIHTFFMFQEIDVVMTDKDHNIIKMYPNFRTNRIILPKKNVYYIYELPLGTCNNFKNYDVLKVKEVV